MDADGNYFLSQSQVAEAVGKSEVYTRQFLQSEQAKALLGEGYTPEKTEIEKDNPGHRGRSRINIIPIQLAALFWMVQAHKGNAKAQALNYACTVEALERRCDKAFGEVKSEDKRNLLLAERATWGDARGYCNSEVKRISVSALSSYLPS
ncbi:hypothetical protein NIES25_55470 (plasmid) [Nostoc linckia NIES-25]|nr:hypothetical protein NIES25_55470 [Nostoc linckia NIES-25]